jgi:Holliday junction DNA helicase RuvA
MIAYISGKITQKDPSFAVIEANGVGYEIKISLQTYSAMPELGSPGKLYTYLSIREDAHVLYGFWESGEKLLFLHLISVSGIGPSIALIMLSSMSASEIRGAILQEDIRTIQSIKGIGAKTAQRLILELKDRVMKEGLETSVPQSNKSNSKRSEALSALVTLGVVRTVAEKSIDTIIKRYGDDISVEELIKLSLR